MTDKDYYRSHTGCHRTPQGPGHLRVFFRIVSILVMGQMYVSKWAKWSLEAYQRCNISHKLVQPPVFRGNCSMRSLMHRSEHGICCHHSHWHRPQGGSIVEEKERKYIRAQRGGEKGQGGPRDRVVGKLVVSGHRHLEGMQAVRRETQFRESIRPTSYVQ